MSDPSTWGEKKKKLRLVVKPSLADAARAAQEGPPKPRLADFIKLTTDVDAGKVADAVEERVTKIQNRMSTAGARMSTAFGFKAAGQAEAQDDFKQQAHGWAAVQKMAQISEDEEVLGVSEQPASALRKMMDQNKEVNATSSLLVVAQAEKARQMQEKRDAIQKKRKELQAKKALLATMQTKLETTKERQAKEVSLAAGRFKKLGAKTLKEEGADDADEAWFALGADDF